MEDNESPTPDARLSASTDIFIKQMDLIWGMMKHISVVGSGGLVAWYYLHSNGDHYLSITVSLLSSSILFILLLVVRRQLQLQATYGRATRPYYYMTPPPKTGILNAKTFSKSLFDVKMTAGHLARLIPTTLILANIILYTFSLSSISENNRVAGLILFIPLAAVLTQTIARPKHVFMLLTHY
ncbi:hypothetical protein QC589_01400 [Halomonas elongata]|uniref:hypothetical protein n=1 Tax=Halomonas elongata TaxID=2746 RepID=UPI00335B6D30